MMIGDMPEFYLLLDLLYLYLVLFTKKALQ